jgi:hypothetical protein
VDSRGAAALAELARRLPDIPRWVETRWMLRSTWCEVTGLHPSRRDFVVRSTRRPLAAVVGRPEAAFIRDAAERVAGGDLIAPEENAEHVASALPGWSREGAVIYRWPEGRPLPARAPAEDVRPVVPTAAMLEHVPAPLAGELLDVAEWSLVVAAYDAGAPASFCYACAVTETLWDVSIDTLEPYRGRGLAERAVGCLMGLMAARGKLPTWGAADSNPASQRLALKLGFQPDDRLALFSAPAR